MTGIAYALPLLPGESPPDIPASKDKWHDHFRTIEDETILPLHHLPGTASDGPRIAMLHAWLWLPNADGVFAADNWAIPYIRLGLTPPEHVSRSAAAAVSLLTGGIDHFAPAVIGIAPLTDRKATCVCPYRLRNREIRRGTRFTKECRCWFDRHSDPFVAVSRICP